MSEHDASEKVLIVDGSRTPFIKAEGTPGPFTPVDLAVWAGRPLLMRQPFPPGEIDDVILGCVNPHYDEVNPGRVAALRLGCGDATPGWTVQRNCASGMQSIDSARQLIASRKADLILAGGTEALSRTPLALPEEAAEWLGDWRKASVTDRAKLLADINPSFLTPIVTLLRGLTDPVSGLGMGQTAEMLAHRFGIGRDKADQFALRSHERLAEAQTQDRLGEIEPMFTDEGEAYERDNGLRADSSLADLARLRPAFEKPYGQVTAGNSSQVTDGASWLLLASPRACERHGLEPLGEIQDCEWAALPPEVMGLGPVFASTPLAKRNELNISDIDLWEINEAFAAQVLACLDAWDDAAFCKEYLDLGSAFGRIDETKLNIDGGAIALGHPVGTSGNRIVLHLLNALRQTGGKRGIATECIGGGQGGAMLLEVV